MSRQPKGQEQPEPSRAAGGCVLAVIGGAALAVVFAVSPTAGVLTVWAVGVAVLWRSVRRTANPAPPPRGPTPSSGVTCEDAVKVARGVLDPNQIMSVLHPFGEDDPHHDL